MAEFFNKKKTPFLKLLVLNFPFSFWNCFFGFFALGILQFFIELQTILHSLNYFKASSHRSQTKFHSRFGYKLKKRIYEKINITYNSFRWQLFRFSFFFSFFGTFIFQKLLFYFDWFLSRVFFIGISKNLFFFASCTTIVIN